MCDSEHCEMKWMLVLENPNNAVLEYQRDEDDRIRESKLWTCMKRTIAVQKVEKFLLDFLYVFANKTHFIFDKNRYNCNIVGSVYLWCVDCAFPHGNSSVQLSSLLLRTFFDCETNKTTNYQWFLHFSIKWIYR